MLAALKRLVRRMRGLPPSAPSPAERKEGILDSVRDHLNNPQHGQEVDYSTLTAMPIEEAPENVLDETVLQRMREESRRQLEQLLLQPPERPLGLAERLIAQRWELCSTRKIWLLSTGAYRLAGRNDKDLTDNEEYVDKWEEFLNSRERWKQYAYDMVVYLSAYEAFRPFPLLPCLFGDSGNPFQESWRTSTVAAIARGMYESRDFSPMPLLADALADAGCENEAILSHCRGNDPHVRGCWVVDMVLGKQ